MTDLVAVRRQAAMDRLYPPPLANELATPSAFATTHSRGMWVPAAHLELIEKACLQCIAEGGRLILSVSVRHGKSEFAARWLVAWYLATHPNSRVILGTAGAELAISHGRAARDILTEYGSEFGVAVNPRSQAANRWDLASPHVGGLIAVGVDGHPTGRGADLMILDDPFGSFAEAMSPRQRQKVREWWAGSLVSRLQTDAAVILIMARWHEDDLAGWLLDTQPERWKELRLPAIADDPDDLLGREIGEPLWPEKIPLATLEERHEETAAQFGEAVWLAQFQGTPTNPKGGMFPEDAWQFVTVTHIDWEPIRWVRGWDLAATDGGGDWTVGVLMGRLSDGRFLISDVIRGRWSAAEVRVRMKRAAAADPPGTRIELPQDPGQAGKDQAQQLVTMLAGRDVHTAPVTGSKEVRATGFAAQQQAGNVVLLEAEWNGTLVAEHQGFPRATHDDIVDAAATAFNVLVGSRVHPEVAQQTYDDAVWDR